VVGVLLVLAAAVSCAPTPSATLPPPAAGTKTASVTTTTVPLATPPPVAPDPAFAPVVERVNAAIAAQRLPGVVVQIGHAGQIVFREAFGSRKLPDEPGLDGAPSPAEPMTEDTIFDLASLTKSIGTTVAVLQLYEQGKLQIDEPVQTYLPDFNPTNDPRRARVTLRMALTHTSGIAGDLSLDGPWGTGRPDKAEGIHRALGAWVVYEPGELFHYSDIGFILLGTIVERIAGYPIDIYVQDKVFAPLGMTDTRYLPVSRSCGPHQIRGNAIAFDPRAPAVHDCPAGTWSTELLARVAPTTRDDDTPEANPDYGNLLRGTVHDPTARRMGGATGSAGAFSTVRDMGRFAQALLDRRAGRPSTFPLAQSTVELMTTPQQPGHSAAQLEAANNATQAAIANSPNTTDPLLAPSYPAIPGQNLRSFGWDIDTPHSTPRGRIFPIGSFGHTGFTGVTLWIDPGSDTYLVVLANVIHQRGGRPIVGLSGDVATLTGQILGLYGS